MSPGPISILWYPGKHEPPAKEILQWCGTGERAEMTPSFKHTLRLDD